MKIFAAHKEDAHQGWVWIQDQALSPRCIIRITNPANGLSVYCEALQIDSNFLSGYNKSPRLQITEPHNALVIGAWYRAGLGGIPTNAEVPLDIHACNSWVGKFCCSIDHPQAVVRVGAWLGAIGLLLGLIGLGLGLLSL